MNNTIKTRKTTNGYTINLVKVGTMYIVTSIHDKKRGYGVRYSGSSLERAEKAYSK